MANVDCRIARALQSYAITYPSPDETLLGTPEALPTAEPATPQIEYTIGSQHLPMVSPAGLACTLTALLYTAGKNTNAASQTVYYRILKNGASIATGSQSVAANTFYTWNYGMFYNVQVGDVLACKLWASGANVNWDYKALRVELTRPASGYNLIKEFSFDLALAPAAALGLPSSNNRYYYISYVRGQSLIAGSRSTGFSTDLWALHEVYSAGQVYLGDRALQSYCLTHSSYRPYYYRNYVPTAISFRPLTIRV